MRVRERGQRGYPWCVPPIPTLPVAFHQQWESCGTLLETSGWRAREGWEQCPPWGQPCPSWQPSVEGAVQPGQAPEGLSELILPQNLGSGQHCGHRPAAAPVLPQCHALSLPLGAAAAPCPRRLRWLLQTDTRTVCTSPCAPSRAWIPALHSPPCFSNANVAFDVHVFILQQKRDPALDKRSTVPTAALQQELPSCSLTRSQRFVIFEEITNLKVFGFGAAIAA